MSTETKTSPHLRVTELARATDVPSDTVRYYERIGLLPPPARTPAGYRTYDDSAVDRIQFIQGAQRLGLRLRDIWDLLAIRDTESAHASQPNSRFNDASPNSTRN